MFLHFSSGENIDIWRNLAKKLRQKYDDDQIVLDGRGSLKNVLTHLDNFPANREFFDKSNRFFYNLYIATSCGFGDCFNSEVLIKKVLTSNDGNSSEAEDSENDFLYGYVDEEKFNQLYESSKWFLGQILQLPVITEIFNDIISKVVDDIPIETINEIVQVVPWANLQTALENADQLDVEDIKILAQDFGPLYHKIMELLEDKPESDLLRLLRFAIDKRLKSSNDCKSNKKVVCYFPNWAHYHKGIKISKN